MPNIDVRDLNYNDTILNVKFADDCVVSFDPDCEYFMIEINHQDQIIEVDVDDIDFLIKALLKGKEFLK
jgi:hypothetical protein